MEVKNEIDYGSGREKMPVQAQLPESFAEVDNGLWYWPDVGKDEQFWSPRFKALIGYRPDEIEASYSTFRMLLHPDDIGDVASSVSDSLNYSTTLNIDFRLRIKSGQYRWFHLLGSSGKDRYGRLRHMTGCISDINGRKQHEAALNNTQLVISAPDLSLHEKLSQLLKITTEYLGLDRGVIAWHGGRNYSVFTGCISKALRAEMQAMVEKIYSGQECDLQGLMAFNDVKTGLSEHHLSRSMPGVGSCIIAPLLVGSEQFGLLMVVSESTREKPFCEEEKKFVQTVVRCLAYELERVHYTSMLETRRKELELQIERLTNSNKKLEHFASAASHDLQEPLRVVTGFINLLHEEYNADLDARAQEYIGYSLESVRRTQALVEDMFRYAHSDQDPEPLRLVNMQDVLNDVKASLSELVDVKHAKITNDELPAVYGNHTGLVSLLQNLIDNAIKYNEASTVPVIHISATEQADAWLFCVQDNGPGIEGPQLQTIFQPFKRLRCYSDYPGSGMGLAICKRLVETWYGEIWAESSPGFGSRFYFTLPKSEATPVVSC